MNKDNIPDSQGDEIAALIRNEVGNQVSALKAELMPNGVGGLMGEIVEQVANKIIPKMRQMIRDDLPVINTDEIAQKAYQLARGQMNEQADKIGAEIESRAASANGAGGMGPGAPTANGHEGHDHGDGEGDGQVPLPPGYSFAKVDGAPDWKQAVKMQLGADPLGIINLVFDKGFMMMERWVKLTRDPNDVETLNKIQQRAPQLLSLYTPAPWGPEYQRMQMDTWNTAMKTKMGIAGVPGEYNPLQPSAPPIGGYKNVSGPQPQPPPGVPASPIASDGQPIRATMPGFVTPSVGPPKTMAQMLGGD